PSPPGGATMYSRPAPAGWWCHAARLLLWRFLRTLSMKGCVSTVIASRRRSNPGQLCTKQAALDCFAALAMTVETDSSGRAPFGKECRGVHHLRLTAVALEYGAERRGVALWR